MSPTSIVAYLALFATVGFLFLFVSLLLGRLLRASAPSPQKQEIYECGEPPVGSGFVQFDLRFYVVALVFIIFDVEVAFFFPWATVFGKATQLANPNVPKVEVAETSSGHPQTLVGLSETAATKYRELGVPQPGLPLPEASDEKNVVRMEQDARALALASLVDIGVFFGVLLVGFAYVWYRGDLNWVRALSSPSAEPAEESELLEPAPEPVSR
jgi:NADH-quinone oxidoreductase subunit A